MLTKNIYSCARVDKEFLEASQKLLLGRNTQTFIGNQGDNTEQEGKEYRKLQLRKKAHHHLAFPREPDDTHILKRLVRNRVGRK